MAENIEWADPERKMVWSFDGRLYRSKSTAMIQWKSAMERRVNFIDRWGVHNADGELHWNLKRPVPPVYEVEWIWRELDDGEYT